MYLLIIVLVVKRLSGEGFYTLYTSHNEIFQGSDIPRHISRPVSLHLLRIKLMTFCTKSAMSNDYQLLPHSQCVLCAMANSKYHSNKNKKVQNIITVDTKNLCKKLQSNLIYCWRNLNTVGESQSNSTSLSHYMLFTIILSISGLMLN